MQPTQTAYSADAVLEAFPESSSVRDYITLLKPGVMMLVVFTSVVAMVLAPGHLHPFLQGITVLCVAIGSGAGGAINMWFDRDIDARMVRTVNRPIPAGRIAPEDALAYGLILSGVSVGLLGIAVNWTAAAYLAGAIAFYVFVYTMWLKRRTPQNIVIGGAAGAFPPVIGWAAVTGGTSWEAWLLFSIIFLWTPPHFWALALYRSGDYARVGVPMLPVVAGVESTKQHIWWYTIVLVAVTLLPVAFGMSGWMYGLAAVALGAQFLRHAARVRRSRDDAVAKSMFAFSIVYLFSLFMAFVIDKVFDMASVFTLV